MGKGDRRTARGKIYRGSYGRSRLHRVKSGSAGKVGGKGTRPGRGRK